MKKIVRLIAFLVALISVFSLMSCSSAGKMQQVKLIDGFGFPKTYEIVYGTFNSDGSTTVEYVDICDENGNYHFISSITDDGSHSYEDPNQYGQIADKEVYIHKNEDGSYTKVYKNDEGSYETIKDYKFLMLGYGSDDYTAYYYKIGKYALKTVTCKLKQLSDVEYLGRECYAFRLTINDSTGHSYTIKTVKEVYIDKETGILMREIITDYNNPSDSKEADEKIGTGSGCIAFSTTPHDVGLS